MAYIEVNCPSCHINSTIKCGNTQIGKQRYRCKNENCSKSTFIIDYSSNGHLPEIKRKIITMAMNGSGVRDTARVLDISVNTVISELKKSVKTRNYKHFSA